MRHQHKLLATNADTSFTGVSVAVGCTENAIELIDLVGLGISIGHTLNSDTGGGVDVGETRGPVPAGTVLAEDSGLFNFLLVEALHGVPVVFINDLCNVFSPSVCHLFFLEYLLI